MQFQVVSVHTVSAHSVVLKGRLLTVEIVDNLLIMWLGALLISLDPIIPYKTLYTLYLHEGKRP